MSIDVQADSRTPSIALQRPELMPELIEPAAIDAFGVAETVTNDVDLSSPWRLVKAVQSSRSVLEL
ncbi:MAG TPA: hypothetical protein VFV01_19060 [Spirillospora sp.]|nr:hypothetical protein [Spirillospora sp.]